eukprot:CAMPEP_0118959276 /NCGR_PEP_ID=MMETSP1169-20130426/63051_1 /TAXON_ID=36882 /ORGANISM="Pyramimonas obovata, Strain CCMP722" /LENGTH=112 /DNA_ID=CAMNT_0006907407 /DNA_START=884 /DNA_END=1219 /DNA_ORIENTATION=+
MALTRLALKRTHGTPVSGSLGGLQQKHVFCRAPDEHVPVQICLIVLWKVGAMQVHEDPDEHDPDEQHERVPEHVAWPRACAHPPLGGVMRKLGGDAHQQFCRLPRSLLLFPA